MPNRDEEELSAVSPIEESDSGFLSPPEVEPNPGLNGTPVRCKSVTLRSNDWVF